MLLACSDAQATMQLRRASVHWPPWNRARSPTRWPGSIDLGAGRLDDLRPFLVLGPDVGHEFVRIHRLDLAAEFAEAPLQVRRLKGFPDFLVQLGGDGWRRSPRSEEGKPARGL